jgi:triacylglycerol esterase/lipase EstA (alpha/beta hydrolase family)
LAAPVRAVKKNDKAVVILLHGFLSNRGLWNPWMRRLNESNVDFVCVNLEPLFGSINNYVALIEKAVRQAEQLSDVKPVVICHSMGGLALRKWLVSHRDARQRVQQIVTIGTPHSGTWMAKFLLSTNGREIWSGSQWLAELVAQEKELRPDDTYAGFVCWYSNCDNMVVPASSGKLSGADNRKIVGIGHLALIYHPRVMQLEQYLCDPSSHSNRCIGFQWVP